MRDNINNSFSFYCTFNAFQRNCSRWREVNIRPSRRMSLYIHCRSPPLKCPQVYHNHTQRWSHRFHSAWDVRSGVRGEGWCSHTPGAFPTENLLKFNDEICESYYRSAFDRINTKYNPFSSCIVSQCIVVAPDWDKRGARG